MMTMLSRRPKVDKTVEAPPAWASVTLPLTAAGNYQRLRAKIKIDKNDLDTNVAEQPETFLEIAEAYSLACSQRDQAKDTLARKDSYLAGVVRGQLATQGLKDTKDNVSDAILLHPDRQVAKAQHDEAVRLADMWGDLRTAFEQRMRMLREEVQLYAVGYFTARSMTGSKEENRTASAAVVRDRMQQARERRGNE